MPGGGADRQLDGPHPYGVSRIVGPIGRRQGLGFETEPCRLLGDAVVKRAVGGVEPDGRTGLRFEPRHAEYVVQVPVGEPDGGDAPVQGLQLVEDQPRGFAGIDHRALARGLVQHQVAVLDELPVGAGHDLHATVAFSFFSRSLARYFSTAMAAVVASPTAVVLWRVTCARTPPAANSPGTHALIFSPATSYTPAIGST